MRAARTLVTYTALLGAMVLLTACDSQPQEPASSSSPTSSMSASPMSAAPSDTRSPSPTAVTTANVYDLCLQHMDESGLLRGAGVSDSWFEPAADAVVVTQDDGSIAVAITASTGVAGDPDSYGVPESPEDGFMYTVSCYYYADADHWMTSASVLRTKSESRDQLTALLADPGGE